jgi:hypothetical protein
MGVESKEATMRTVAEVNKDVNAICEAHGVKIDGPGEEAFWNAVEDVAAKDAEAGRALEALSREWEEAWNREHP